LIRVLHVLDKICVDSGASRVVMNYYSKLDHSRLTFDFMLNEDPDAETRAFIEDNGSKIFIMPGLKATNTFKYIKALKEFYKTHDYRIVHGHVANSAVFYLGLARKKVPFRIIHSHNTKSADILWKRLRNWVLTRFIRKECAANRYFACSRAAAEFLFGPKNDVLIVNNAIEIESFLFNANKRDSIRSELSLDDKMVVGHVGRFCTQKNHSFLIDVFAEFYQNNPNAVLLLTGSGELYDDIKRRVKNRGLGDAVIFTGPVNNVDEHMNAMDVFVLPSLFEGLPLTGVEAQINGLPCIFSDRVTTEVQISDEVLFLPLGHTSLWVEGISRMLDCGRADAENVRVDEFDINVQIKRLEAYYSGLFSEDTA